MKVKCRKVRAKDRLKFTVDFTNNEIESYEIFGHELKCFLFYEEDKFKDTNNYIYYNSIPDEYYEDQYSDITFSYYNRSKTKLILKFLISFPQNNNLKINYITLEHVRKKTYIKDSDSLFRIRACSDVKEILEHLFNRNNQGSFCKACIHMAKQNLVHQCYNSFKEKVIKING